MTDKLNENLFWQRVFMHVMENISGATISMAASMADEAVACNRDTMARLHPSEGPGL